MNIKHFSLLAGLAAITLTSFPMAANAHKMHRSFSKLNLTDQQEQQIENIRNNTYSEIEDILTPQQQEQFETIKTLRGQLREAKEATNLSQEQREEIREIKKSVREEMKSMNLSQDQRDDIREIKKSAREEMMGILTDEQRQQIRQEMGSRRGKRGFRRGSF